MPKTHPLVSFGEWKSAQVVSESLSVVRSKDEIDRIVREFCLDLYTDNKIDPIYDAIDNYMSNKGPKSRNIDRLYPWLEILSGYKRKYPKALNPGITHAFRGLQVRFNPKFLQNIDLENPTHHTEMFGIKFVAWDKINYTPMSIIESWSANDRIASLMFARCGEGYDCYEIDNPVRIVLEAKIDKNFIMNPNFMEIISDYYEEEIFRFDKQKTPFPCRWWIPQENINNLLRKDLVKKR